MAIVTMTTDFGSADGYVGAMKGVILSVAAGTTIVDITHGIPAQDVPGGAVALAQAAPHFPRGTIHVAVVDPGVGSGRADLIVEAAGAFFVGPDNGLLSIAARGPRRAWRIEAPAFRRDPASPTFHGRDVFAPAAGRLALGTSAAEAGPAQESIVELAPAPVRQIDGRVDGVVTYIDAFGNLVTSVSEDHMCPEAAIELDCGDAKFRPPIRRTFSDVGDGELVAYVGSSGQLEIARRNGSAAVATGARRGSIVRVRRLS